MGITIYIEDENIGLFYALSSKTRLAIIRLLATKSLNIKQIAENIGMSMAIVTRHVNILSECGIVISESLPSSKGRQRVCSLKEESITVFLKSAKQIKDQKIMMQIGDYSKAIDVQSPCGFENENGIKGIEDDPRYFLMPDRRDIVKYWFSNGVMKYRISGALDGTQIRLISVRFLMSVNNASGSAEHGSAYFSFCEKIFWHDNFPVGDEPVEYMIILDENGVCLNGDRVSNQGIDNYDLDARHFSFEIGAGYYKGKKSVVTIYSSDVLPGLEMEIVFN